MKLFVLDPTFVERLLPVLTMSARVMPSSLHNAIHSRLGVLLDLARTGLPGHGFQVDPPNLLGQLLQVLVHVGISLPMRLGLDA